MNFCENPADAHKVMNNVSVIIVTYNSEECIEECLSSVLSQQGINTEALVIDNNSSDATLEKVAKYGCRIIKNSKNLGFGKACNQGAEHSTGNYLFFLNPDACLMRENSLSRLISIMIDNPQWGLAGTRVLAVDGESESKPATHYPDQKHTAFDFAKLPGCIAWVIGASMVIRKDLFKEMEGFDPDYFLYSEETDLCLRIRKKGHEIGYVEEVVVSHVGGKSESGCDPKDTASRKLQGLFLFRKKHYTEVECLKLARRDSRRAFFRMIYNRVASIFSPEKSTEWGKYRSYLGVWQTSRDYLSSMKKT